MNLKTSKRIALGLAFLLCAGSVGCMRVKAYIDAGAGYIPEPTAGEVRYMSPEEYYSTNGKIVDRIDVTKSAAVHTEAEAVALFADRGFTQYPVTADFSLEGEVLDDTQIADPTAEKHPVYTTCFLSATGELWTVMDINGRLFANPASYNADSSKGVPLLISETDSVLSYDAEGNRYYETIPAAAVTVVVKVARIDADTLNGLTREALDKR